MGDPALVEAALNRSGLSLRLFAERVLGRDERTVRRWRSGAVAVPDHARRWLEAYNAGKVRLSGSRLTAGA